MMCETGCCAGGLLGCIATSSKALSCTRQRLHPCRHDLQLAPHTCACLQTTLRSPSLVEQDYGICTCTDTI